MKTQAYSATWPQKVRHGDSGPAVVWIQEKLTAAGAFRGACLGNFLGLTLSAVQYFQATHLGPDDCPLEVDGEVGPRTRWALANPSGAAQRSFLDPLLPEGLSGSRRQFLETVAADYRSGEFVEIPDGSNGGPRISAFSRGTYWCCFYQSDAWRRTFGEYPLGVDHGHCLTFWLVAKGRGMALDKKTADPLPGDLGVMLYRSASGAFTGSGHIFAVSNVESGGRRFNSFGGNEGNRLKHGLRSVSESALVGWIDLHGGGRKVDFVPGLVTASGGASGLTATR